MSSVPLNALLTHRRPRASALPTSRPGEHLVSFAKACLLLAAAAMVMALILAARTALYLPPG